jgi:hypothetical protein
LWAPPAGCVDVIPAPPEGGAAVDVECAVELPVWVEAPELAAELALALALVEDGPDGPDGTDGTDTVAAGALAELDAWPEPPQPASTSTTVTTPRWPTKRVTSRA